MLMTKFYFINNMIFKNHLMNYLFTMMMIFSTIIVINSYSWINAWMGLEINMLSFIPLMIFKSKNKISNAMMIYFIIQASSSSMLLMLIMMTKMNLNFNMMNFIMNMIQITLLMKLGATPFHWWMPKILIYLNWMNCFYILTWQKISPLMMLMNSNNNTLIYLISLMSMLFSTIIMINQTSIKLMMTYSSINHLGWMLMLMLMNSSMMIIYFIIYLLMNLSICLMMNKLNFTYLNQMFKINNKTPFESITIMLLFMSIAGLPPMLGFMPKILTIMIMIKNKFLIETFLLIILSAISLSMYINPMLSMLMLTKMNNKWKKNKMNIKNFLYSMFIINMTLITLMLTPLMNNFM
uniref:NADH-ubiquinone oxidoreductase chain 2 n=1 Tax=Metallus mai TaxID=2782261 RepID=A0A7T5Y0Z3_9HYME|nr:NADH dehydrogenase subunit 2 [Metallus mai]